MRKRKMKNLMQILNKKLKNFNSQIYVSENLKKFQITILIYLMSSKRLRVKNYKQLWHTFLQNNKYLNQLAR